MTATAVLLNNFFHDLSVALLTCTLAGVTVLWRALAAGTAVPPALVSALEGAARRLATASLAGIVGFGAVRTWAFMEYEWLPAAGRNIVPALIVKHVVLASLLGGAAAAAWRARRHWRTAEGSVGGARRRGEG
jgi:hypothetical protein